MPVIHKVTKWVGNTRVNGRAAEPVKLFETSGGWVCRCGLLGLDGGAGLVDPHLGGQGRGERAASAEPARAGGEGVVENLLAARLDGPGGAVVDRGWRMKADPGMAMLGVVVGEENVAEGAGFVQGGEAAGEDRAVFEGLERRLGIRRRRNL